MSFLSNNNPLIIGDINAPIKSEIGNLDDLQTTDKSSLVNALNEALGSTLNGASRNLDNLSDNGNARLHALKGYADEGELLTDPDGLAFVEKYAHSTFDLSKFTVVGSPNITSDGIASGFSTSNYITKQNAITIGSSGEFHIDFSFNSMAYTNIQYILDVYNTGSNEIVLRRGANGNDYTCLIFVGGTTVFNKVVTVAQNDIKGFIEYKNGVYTFDLNGTQQTLTSSTTMQALSYSISYGARLSSGTATQPLINGLIDLKQFSITVDGVEVFSGNKTGIDTIKSDDYTVVGTPTISADGIASGFSQTSYLLGNNISIPANSKIEIILKLVDVIALASTEPQRSVFSIRNTDNTLLDVRFSATGGSAALVYANSATTRGTESISGLDLTGIYFMKFVFDNGTLKAYKGNTLDTLSQLGDTITDVYMNLALDTLYIGTSLDHATFPFKGGSIDLNAFKIYVDGNLVYQPCLKIPYTESKTGSKIVDSVYRERVNDMAEQFGFAPYYTLSDTDFTLPQVELYGLIGQRTLRDSYRNGATYWELWSDRTQEIGGTCTSGVEYNLPRSFASATDYVLSVPYSAKTASSFTPTASGDFIAKGLGVL